MISEKSSDVRPCFDKIPDICLPSMDIQLPLWTEKRDELLSVNIQKRFENAQISPLGVKAFSICPGIFNQKLALPENNKFKYDFELMLELILKFAKEYPDRPLLALCGKVGGTKRYLPWFYDLGYENLQIIKEDSEQSSYKLGKLIEISFIKNGDDSHLPISVASMIGKYLRELAMEQLNDKLGPVTRKTSGYHNKVTVQFIKETQVTRRRIGLDEKCFIRNS
jgi:hypothetical protein